MQRLGAVYDWASKTVHGSPYSFALRLSVEKKGTARQFNFGYVDFIKSPAEAERDVLNIFMVHIGNHLLALQAFARALKDVLEKKVWDLHFNTAEGLFESHRDRLAPLLRPQPGQRHPGGLVVPGPISPITPARLVLWTPRDR